MTPDRPVPIPIGASSLKAGQLIEAVRELGIHWLILNKPPVLS
jgi:hypothetical protein